MTKEELAALLNGREYRHEISAAEAASAKEAGLLVVFGASDDLLELRGAIDDETGCYGGGVVMVHSGGVLPAWEDLEKDEMEDVERWFQNRNKARPLSVDWDCDGYSWIVRTEVPHATFEIVDDGDKYCRGVVLRVADLFDGAA